MSLWCGVGRRGCKRGSLVWWRICGGGSRMCIHYRLGGKVTKGLLISPPEWIALGEWGNGGHLVMVRDCGSICPPQFASQCWSLHLRFLLHQLVTSWKKDADGKFREYTLVISSYLVWNFKRTVIICSCIIANYREKVIHQTFVRQYNNTHLPSHGRRAYHLSHSSFLKAKVILQGQVGFLQEGYVWFKVLNRDP